MASSISYFLFFSSLLFISSSNAQSSFRPHALVIPVSKDSSTLQYVTSINQRTPLVPLQLVVDLGGQFLWVDCEQNYVSSSYRPARCTSAQCSLARGSGCGNCFSAPKPGCNNTTCSVLPDNTVTRTASSDELAEDAVSVQSTDGSNPASIENLPCLSSSTTADGVILLGDGSYGLLPNVDASQLLIYTPLILNPVSTASAHSQGEPSAEYFIGVKSIQINEKAVPLNTSLLSINSKGVGGTKISTVNPYTVMETSIYSAFTKAFISAAASMNITRVAAVAPFSVCFSSKNVYITRGGTAVPTIGLVLQNNSVVWRVFGANSMVFVNGDVLCLGFVDGGANPRTSIVIGGYQLEDNLLQFDLAASRLGFSSSLLFSQTTCSNFNFTSN
ncbi:hypothetical protein VitviT2T_009908 [Vitis vinifera]|uniref:Peptidase A1 domain-containing protein n=2 Tax=Vitis vinifera TaxID=29760 RepID=A0ABY9C9F5_VITVI|nr:hypothetical protein VitviT2T_009908 [Vitis vinifera]